MQIKEANFVTSAANYLQCPDADIPEYAFIGRSNVGKSSLINMLTERKKLAKISGRPGKTQLINHFLINQQWHLVDLPGYGWAKVSKFAREGFGHLIQDYLLNRPQLVCLFVLIDSRHSPQNIDLRFIEWIGVHQIPFVLAFTKADKQSHNKTQKSMTVYRKTLKKTWAELPPIFVTSAVDSSGREDLLDYIAHTLGII